MKAFRLGINMAGVISAEACTARVFDFLRQRFVSLEQRAHVFSRDCSAFGPQLTDFEQSIACLVVLTRSDLGLRMSQVRNDRLEPGLSRQ